MAQYNVKGIRREKLINILTGKGYRKSDAAYVVDNLSVRGGSLSWEGAAEFLKVPRSTLQVWLSESKRSRNAYDSVPKKKGTTKSASTKQKVKATKPKGVGLTAYIKQVQAEIQELESLQKRKESALKKLSA